MYGPYGPQAYQRPGAQGGTQAAAPIASAAEVKLVNFTTTDSGNASRIAKGNTVYTDSVNYLPPNSFARAKVIVGVDASAGVNSQSDPLPVVLRVTGPARSVYQNGRLLTTKIEGCLINGAARGDLSSEKVYVKLQKMTCPQPGGRYAVSEVKGFIAFGGKTGVRGRVVSREGSLVTQAFLAGLAGGFGRGFSANANSVFQGTNITTNGQRQKLSTGDILEGGFGEGVAQTGDMVSKYLIERAEQYQPVIEMPTGIDVEIVFLEGVYVRN
jgi:conjugal transfer pilus assembly protein TraB|tara:strand:+ start:14 stop:823 length:810 start_codon:yes stop_codon:yes gene_type:complete